uniref:Pleckstrin homology domain-containing family M member 2 n=1 Tax=Sparus aurata TaxID=8175 RepID=A0A671UL66_SPAAU
MDQLKVKDRILENISLSVKKLQSYFAACEDETPAIRNHDRVLQRLCEHLDHALLYGLQDISSGYWVLVLHFTRREAVRQIDELQHIATNLGRSRAWLYLALSESSLESYLRLFQENQALLHKYYFNGMSVTFLSRHLIQDVPYLDVAPYMPEYYKPQNLLDFEERLPSSDSLSLHSFTSLTSTNLEWDDSAIAPSSEDYDFGDIFPVLQSLPSADWEEGDLTDQASCPRSSGSDPQTVAAHPSPHSPTSRHNPFNEDSDTNTTNTSADVTPVHVASRYNTTIIGDDMENASNELEVIRYRSYSFSFGLVGSHSTGFSCIIEHQIIDVDSLNGTVIQLDSETELRRSRVGSEVVEEGDEDGVEGLLRLPEMADTSMDTVGQPLRDVMDRLNGALDREEAWEHPKGKNNEGCNQGPELPAQQPFREDSGGEPPDRAPGDTTLSPLASPNFLQASPAPADVCCFTSFSPGSTPSGGGHYDSTELSKSQTLSGGLEDEGEAKATARQEPDIMTGEEDTEGGEDKNMITEEAEELQEDKLSPSESSHPAEFKVDNNHLLLLMIHVFRENEEQLFKVKRDDSFFNSHYINMCSLHVLVIHLCLSTGAAEKPYFVEEAVSYNELDYISVGLDQQTVTVVCTNRRRKFLLDTADASLTLWFLSVLKSAMVKGCREPPYPSVLTDATMEKLALTKFISQESQCEVSEVSIQLYSLVHWEDPMDMALSPHSGPPKFGVSSSTKEGTVQYRAGTTYLGKELWKSCYLILSNGILYLYAERTDVAPLLSVTMGGEHCGGCRRSNSTERPHAFQVILTERPPLELSANNEQDMADWMQLLCQSVSKGVIPQGVAPTPCIPCCLVVTDGKLLTCHQDCQTSFFRSLGSIDICDVTAVSVEADKHYCVIEFAADRTQYLPPWVLYFSGCEERDRLLEALDNTWKAIFQVDLPHRGVMDPSVQKRCGEALALMNSAWQRADSLARGRAQREPWC